MNIDGSLPEPWGSIGDRLRGRGLRWTPQRETVIAVLADTVPGDHVTAAELVERCRARDGRTVPSTVYRTLDVLEDLGLVRHGHGADGREEYHVLPAGEHGHLHCSSCSATWEITPRQAEAVVTALKGAGGFEIDIGHVTLVGRCADCARDAPASVRR
ncbi:MAG TPA: Fur family transcriptional regulator [Candidatus Limnocylindria bacterium]